MGDRPVIMEMRVVRLMIAGVIEKNVVGTWIRSQLDVLVVLRLGRPFYEDDKSSLFSSSVTFPPIWLHLHLTPLFINVPNLVRNLNPCFSLIPRADPSSRACLMLTDSI
jgi:hypothetical protein